MSDDNVAIWKNVGVVGMQSGDYLSLRMVHSSPPKHASISIYRYLLSLNVLYNLNWQNVQEIKGEFN